MKLTKLLLTTFLVGSTLFSSSNAFLDVNAEIPKSFLEYLEKTLNRALSEADIKGASDAFKDAVNNYAIPAQLMKEGLEKREKDAYEKGYAQGLIRCKEEIFKIRTRYWPPKMQTSIKNHNLAIKFPF